MTLSRMMSDQLHVKRITFRHHGLHGELRRPMFHRFPVKGGISLVELMAETIVKSNPLLTRLMRRGQ